MYGFPTWSADQKKLLVVVAEDKLSDAVKQWETLPYDFVSCMKIAKTLVTCVDERIAQDICTVFGAEKKPCPECPPDLNTWIISFSTDQDFCEYLSMSNMANVIYLNGTSVFNVSFDAMARKTIEKLKLIDDGEVKHEEKPIDDDAWLKDLGIVS